MARQFAVAGGAVGLVARRVERLEALATEIERAGGRAVPIGVDLLDADAADRIVAEVTEKFGGPIDVLANNAGTGEYGQFRNQSIDALERMMTLNMTALVRLTHAVLPDMIARKRGKVLNIASTAAYQPCPYMAVYGATKSFVQSFSMALWCEVRKHGVGVTCVCPGPVDTEFFDHGGYESRKGDFTKLAMSPDRVASEAIRAMLRGRSMYVPGFSNKVGAIMQRFAPLRTVTRLTAKLLGPK